MGKLYRLADKQSILYNRLGLQLGLSLVGLKLKRLGPSLPPCGRVGALQAKQGS